MSRNLRMKELIDRYIGYQKMDNGSKHYKACLARDNSRKISQTFEREMHEPIDMYVSAETNEGKQ